MKQNKHVEDWATRREHIENEFRWDGKSLANIALWVFAFPYFVYSVRCGRQRRGGGGVRGGGKRWGRDAGAGAVGVGA